MNKTCLITGITGQDGYWLTKMLKELGYEVHGLVRRGGVGCLEHLNPELGSITLHMADVTDACAVDQVVHKIRPNELYHLAAFSSVKGSWDNQELTYQTNVLGTLNVLNAVKNRSPETRVLFVSSSEMFGNPSSSPQNELTPINPVSPYGISKAAAYQMCHSFRNTYKMYVSTAISYNHDSFCRPVDFVVAKICAGAAAIKQGRAEHIVLGNLDSRRDFGHAADYVRAYWNMLQGDQPETFVLATGITYSIREMCDMAFQAVGMELTWHNEHKLFRETATHKGKEVIIVSYEHFRPTENKNILVGDAANAMRAAVFTPTRTAQDIINEIINHHTI